MNAEQIIAALRAIDPYTRNNILNEFLDEYPTEIALLRCFSCGSAGCRDGDEVLGTDEDGNEVDFNTCERCKKFFCSMCKPNLTVCEECQEPKKILRKKEEKRPEQTKEKTKENLLVQSKLLKDKGKQKEYFSDFAKRFIAAKYREQMIEYLFHIHPDDRWSFISKIKKQKLSVRRPYIELLFDADEDLNEIYKNVYKKVGEKKEGVRKHPDLYNYMKEPKSCSLIYEAFLKKIEEQEPGLRGAIYLYFVGTDRVAAAQKTNKDEIRVLTWRNFFAYLDGLKKEEKERFIDLLFDPDFDLSRYIDQ